MRNRKWNWEAIEFYRKPFIEERIIESIIWFFHTSYIVLRFYPIAVISFSIGFYILWNAFQSYDWFMIFVGMFIAIIGGQYSIRKNTLVG